MEQDLWDKDQWVDKIEDRMEEWSEDRPKAEDKEDYVVAKELESVFPEENANVRTAVTNRSTNQEFHVVKLTAPNVETL